MTWQLMLSNERELNYMLAWNGTIPKQFHFLKGIHNFMYCMR